MPTFRSPCRTNCLVSRRRCTLCLCRPLPRSPWQAAPATGIASAGADTPLAPLGELRRALGCASRCALMSAVVRKPPPTPPTAWRTQLLAAVSAISSAHAPRRLRRASRAGVDSPNIFSSNSWPTGRHSALRIHTIRTSVPDAACVLFIALQCAGDDNRRHRPPGKDRTLFGRSRVTAVLRLQVPKRDQGLGRNTVRVFMGHGGGWQEISNPAGRHGRTTRVCDGCGLSQDSPGASWPPAAGPFASMAAGDANAAASAPGSAGAGSTRRAYARSGDW